MAKPDCQPSAQDTQKLLSESEKRAWLRLSRTPQIGSVTFWELVSYFGNAETALKALPELAKRGARFSAHSIPTPQDIEEELEKAYTAGMTLVALGEPGYPPLLARVELPPPLLYVKGAPGVWDRPPFAIVGSRQASAAGLKFAGELAAKLGSRGFLIVSGLARGIDAAAHRAALPYATCAVLGGGLDRIYPAEHSELAAKIAENGLLVSECPPGFVARAQDFPRRNRIISGCCLGVAIVEATERSGSLITARLAADQSRDVFAVPGHPFEPRSAGTNRLIKEGAILTTGASDVEDALQTSLANWESVRGREVSPPLDSLPATAHTVPGDRTLPGTLGPMEEAARDVLKLLSFSPIDVDDLCRLSGMEARHLHAALLTLDLSGHIERRGLRQIVLRP